MLPNENTNEMWLRTVQLCAELNHVKKESVRRKMKTIIRPELCILRNSQCNLFLWRNSPTWAQVVWLLTFLDDTKLDTHTHKRARARTHTHTHICAHIHLVRLLWTRDRLVAEADTYTTHNKHKGRTAMPLEEFEPAIPTIERTCAWDRAATGIGNSLIK